MKYFKKLSNLILVLIIISTVLPMVAFGAFTDGVWVNLGTYAKPNVSGGLNLLISGSNKYLNWGSTVGTSGYGIRDNAGSMEFKDSGGAWAGFGTGGGGASPLTTKGDLYTFSTVDDRLAKGTDGYILSSNSATSTGLEWITPPISMAIGGSITSATAGSVLFADTAGVLAQDNTNFFWNNTTKQLTLSSSLTGSQATNGLSITPTWNTTGNPVALSVNITNTASGTASKLFDFQTSGVSKLLLTPGGLLQFGVTGTGGVQSHSINPVIYMGTNIVGLTSGNGDLMLSGRQGYGIGFQTSASGATVLRLAILNNGTIQLAGGAIVTGDPVLTGTNNSGSTGPAINNSGSGGGTSVNLYLRTAGTDRASIGAFNTGDFIIRTGGSTEAVRITSGLNMGVGTGATVSARIHGISTTEQLRLGYNSTKYLSTTVSSTGSATFALTGTTPTFTFSQNINAPAFITVGGSSSQFVKGDGSLDSSTYLTSSDFISTPFSTSNGVTVSLSNQLSGATMSVTASAATMVSAGIVDTNAQEFGGNKYFRGRLKESSGTFSGTSSVTLGDDGNFFAMGSGTLDEINLTGWDNGSEISLYFPSGGTITNNFTPTGGYGPFLILAGANKTVPTGGIVKFILLNGNWMEVAS